MSRVLPILFNTDMVREILDGRKTITRRCIKPQPIYSKHDGFSWKGYVYGTDLPPTIKGAAYNFRCAAPYQPGDILYVRETRNYGYIETSDIPESIEAWFEPVNSDCGDYIKALSRYFYKADDDAPGKDVDMIWRPSIHMPKEAARIWLRVTDVRVERLQDITPKEALKEGASCWVKLNGELDDRSIMTEYISAWNSTIKKKDLPIYGWGANPWVWVISFERCEKPEEV